MKNTLNALLITAIENLQAAQVLPQDIHYTLQIDATKNKAHGDFATNLAMMLAKSAGMPPRALAEKLVAALPEHESVTKTDIAGPGFINFFVNEQAKMAVVTQIHQQAAQFGQTSTGQGASVLVEFVSANPTGPLHVGHGRGAAYGASLANLLAFAGYQVTREYYVNDAGRQMDILATSVWLRYLELCGETFRFPSNGYKGDYIYAIARQLEGKFGQTLRKPSFEVMAGIVPDDGETDAQGQPGDKERHIDDLIAKAKALLGAQDYEHVFNMAIHDILADIEEDLAEFGVKFDNWFSERSLMHSGVVDAAIEKLQQAGKIYEQNGALWFRSTDYGDEKDRVVVRENGIKTYFASDIAYHFNKLEREFETLIDIWGADHHGYIPRVKAAMDAMGTNPDALQVQLVQFAILYRGGERAQMSTRSGQFVTLRELRDEVGNDAARYFYVSRKSEQHMDFDLDLAKSKSNENPVYYIQYAHARICSVLQQVSEKGFSAFDAQAGLANLALLTTEHEQDVAAKLAQFPELIGRAAEAREPHQIAYYLKDLAHALHSYYNAQPLLVEDDALRNARLSLLVAIKQVLVNGLTLLGVSAPERM
ncbi:arginine--tRNA ligase [Thiomicrospira sp. ALE5]|uniref:arginine--tRNA ligase n=1 Tax=Thiomicrospira sp. ALE5 TaxID=748650 RepID=UPI0008F0DD50|nr:arginine--tRNA ligase [Thiomicrospira sp. ALE5]SFR55107.1 arginyl-tRNA synthetase [Thiomicrospira sp. ALE5]